MDKRGVFQKQDCVDDILNFSHASDWLRKELLRIGSKHRRFHDVLFWRPQIVSSRFSLASSHEIPLPTLSEVRTIPS
jgi:hypothetical protein